MSGICGVVRFDGAAADDALSRQLKALSHLGPDKVRRWQGGSAAMGALLMRTTREDAFDQQPLHEPALNLTFVSDARIDNREEIADLLNIGEAELQSMPDSALLFAAYRAWGSDCAERLVGDFVFAVWDADMETITLGRDHMGQRHLFFHKGDGFFAFASEKKGLWALPEVPRLFPIDTLATMLSRGAPGPRGRPALIPHNQIGAVPGGSILTVSAAGEIATRRYWTPRADPAHEHKDEAYYIAAYRQVLGEAVACRLRRATTPAGLFMSGGFDSTAICALAGPVVSAQGRKLVAVASVMPADYTGTIQHARTWVEAAGRHMPHLDVRYVVGDDLDLLDGLTKSFLARDNAHSVNRPYTDAMVTEIRNAGARIMMDGHGGDYTLNPQYGAYLYRLLRNGRIIHFLREFRARRRFTGLPYRSVFRDAVLKHHFQAARVRRFYNALGQSLSRPHAPVAAAFESQAIASRGPRQKGWRSPREQIRTSLQIQQDEPSAGYSISAASQGMKFTQPFHDKRVVELALAIPEALYAKDGRERYLARMALGELYPPELLARGPGNHNIGPDSLALVKRAEPQILAEIDRMEARGKLSSYFDFPRMRQLLLARSVDQHASGAEYETGLAMSGFIWARYMEWFNGDNA